MGVTRLGIFAIKKIQCNDELSFDYMWESRESGESTECKCKASKCRGTMDAKVPLVTNKQNTNHGALVTEMTSKKKELTTTTKKRKRNNVLEGISTVPVPNKQNTNHGALVAERMSKKKELTTTTKKRKRNDVQEGISTVPVPNTQNTNHGALVAERTSKKKELTTTTKKRKRNDVLEGISTVPVRYKYSALTKRSRKSRSPLLYQRHLREGLSEEQLTFLQKNMSTDEERLSNGNKCSIHEAVQYVRSFEHTFFCKSFHKHQSISCTFDDFCKAENKDVSSFLTSNNSKKTYYCHIPIQLGIGNGQTTHMIGVTVALLRREIIVYDTERACSSSYGSSEKDRTYDVEAYMNDESNEEAIRKVVTAIYEKVREPISIFKWKVVTITEWLQKDIKVDCGIYVLFFFECIARKAKLTLGAHDDNSGTYLSYRRQWIAFSLCVRRILSSI
jgi:hypothetical protein